MFQSRRVQVFFPVLALAALVSAQDFRAKISGRIADESGAAVPNATVSLLNKRTGVKTVRQSNGEGLYRIDFVDPGAYTVTIEALGFATFVQEMPEVRFRIHQRSPDDEPRRSRQAGYVASRRTALEHVGNQHPACR